MDNYRERSRRHSQYSDFEPNNDSTRENFGSHQARSSKSNSGSPKSHRHSAQSISFECKVCLNTYKNNKELYHHLHAAQHLRPLSRLKTAEETESYQSRKRKFYGFTCKVCDAEFSSHSALKTHINVAGHHWSEKRARHLSKHQNDSYPHKKHSEYRHRSSSTDQRSENSLVMQNADLSDTEDSKGKSSSLSVQSSGSSDVILDDSVTLPQRNSSIVGAKEHSNMKKATHSSNITLDNNHSIIITSPDNSFTLQSTVSVEVSSTSENQKLMPEIPTEPHFPTSDPRPNFPISEKDAMGNQSKNLNAKWAPIYHNRPKPNLVEKRIPWKLIPIDLSLSRYSSNQRSNSDRPTSVPSTPEDALGTSIDQLAEQLKENTAATFIPHSRLTSSLSFEANLLPCPSRDMISSHVSSTSASEERPPSRTSTPCLDETINTVVNKRNSVSVGGQSSYGRPENQIGSLLVLDPWHPDSTSGSPYTPKCDYPSSPDRIAVSEVPNLPLPIVPKPIPLPIVDHQVDAAILEELGTLELKPCAKSLLPTSIPTTSSRVQKSNVNTQNKDTNVSQTSSIVVRENPKSVAAATTVSSPTPKSEIDNVESFPKLFCETKKNEVTSKPSECSNNSSPEPVEQSITIGEVVELCPECQAFLDSSRLKIDLKTGNASTCCRNCGLRIVMERVFKKIR